MSIGDSLSQAAQYLLKIENFFETLQINIHLRLLASIDEGRTSIRKIVLLSSKVNPLKEFS